MISPTHPTPSIRAVHRAQRLLTLSILMLASVLVIGGFTKAVHAQTTGTPIPPTIPIGATPEPAEVLNQAQAALTQAQAALAQSQAVATQAAQVSSQAGIVLNFIQVVAILGSVLGAVAGVLVTVNGLRTLSEYQGDLAKSRTELGQMRTELEAATARAAQTSKILEDENARQVEIVKDELVKAYRSLGLLQVGEQQFELGNHKAALQLYQQAYQLNPANEIVSYFLGELYLIERDLPQAVKYLEQAI